MQLTRVPMILAVAAVTGVAAVALPADAVPVSLRAPLSPAAAAARDLAASGAAPAIRTAHGVIASVTARPGHPIGTPSTGSAETAARGFLARYGAGFGLAHGDSGLATRAAETTADGTRIVRFQQRVGGVPVIGGDLVVSTDRRGGVLSAAGEVTERPPAVSEPRVSRPAAVGTAIRVVAQSGHVAAAALTGSGARWLYDPSLIGAPGPAGARQVWQVDVVARNGAEHPRRRILVDAATGAAVLGMDLDASAKQRLVCDFTSTPISYDPTCTATSPKLARKEGQAASSVADVNKAYELTGVTYDFYASHFGRNSIDNFGLPLRSAVRVCFTDDCPWQNAYWDGDQMVFGDGFASADDVVGHELTHGVTGSTSMLYYAYQSGAINESFSDIMGEFIDQEYAGGTTDGPQYDWLLGEDLPSSIGVIRNMADPGQFGDPDNMLSPHYVGESHYFDPYFPDDSGGVHTNSGVGNKAAYLMTAPGTRTFRGVTVTGIGLTKAEQVYYRTMLLLTSGSDYADLAAALQTACGQLAGTSTAGITSGDCVQVRNATEAVSMTADPVSPTASAPDVALCPAGTGASATRFNDFEDGLGDWTVDGTPSDGWELVYGYAHSGMNELYAQAANTYATPSRTATWAPLSLPAGHPTYVAFSQNYQFDTAGSQNRDGGRAQYRVGTGAWTDASALFTDGSGYTGDLSGPAGTGPAFTGQSHGYRSSRLDLSAFAGQTFQLRFVRLADPSNASYWTIDDIEAYACTTEVAGLHTTARAPGSATLSWTPLTGATGFEVSASGDPVAGLPTTVTGSELTLTGLTANGSYGFTVRPVLAGDTGTPTSVSTRRTTVSLRAPAASVASGAAAKLTGTVAIPGGGTPTGQVKLLWRRRGTSTWATAGTAAVGAAGTFSISPRPSASMEFTAQTYGGTNQLASASPVVTVGAVPVVTLTGPAPSVRRGATVRFTGATTPVRGSAAASVQVYARGAWRTIATAATYTNGRFSIPARLSTRGRFSYRIALAGATAYAAAVSPARTITTS